MLESTRRPLPWLLFPTKNGLFTGQRPQFLTDVQALAMETDKPDGNWKGCRRKRISERVIDGIDWRLSIQEN